MQRVKPPVLRELEGVAAGSRRDPRRHCISGRVEHLERRGSSSSATPSVRERQEADEVADKSNAMQQGHALWTAPFSARSRPVSGHPGNALLHRRAAMYMVLHPGQFEVIVTTTCSARYYPDWQCVCFRAASHGRPHLPGIPSTFEPVEHGSAPGLPEETLRTRSARFRPRGSMLETLGLGRLPRSIRPCRRPSAPAGHARRSAVPKLGTREAGEYIVSQIAEGLRSESR